MATNVKDIEKIKKAQLQENLKTREDICGSVPYFKADFATARTQIVTAMGLIEKSQEINQTLRQLGLNNLLRREFLSWSQLIGQIKARDIYTRQLKKAETAKEVNAIKRQLQVIDSKINQWVKKIKIYLSGQRMV